MITVLFKRSNGERIELETVPTVEEAFDVVNKFLEDHNYKSYYTRMWAVDNELELDVGSYTEFFYLRPEEGMSVEDIYNHISQNWKEEN